MKRIFNTLARKWPDYLLEMLVITAGILGAFMLNSWKEGRDRQGEETNILIGLKNEFEANLTEVNRNIELNRIAVQSCISAIELIRSEDPFADQRLLDSLMQGVYMFGTLNSQTGLVDEVISSGKLSIIRDPELRKKLTSLSGILDNADEDYVVRGNYYTYEILPYLSQYFPLANQDQYMDFSNWSDTYESHRVSGSPFRLKLEQIELLQLENYLYQHKVNNDFVNLNEYNMRQFFTETLALINTNLARAE